MSECSRVSSCADVVSCYVVDSVVNVVHLLFNLFCSSILISVFGVLGTDISSTSRMRPFSTFIHLFIAFRFRFLSVSFTFSFWIKSIAIFIQLVFYFIFSFLSLIVFFFPFLHVAV